MAGPPNPIVLWKWRVYDQRKKRWRELRWMMDDETAARWAESEGAQIEKVEGSAEERRDLSGAGHWGNLPGPPGWDKK